MTFIGGVMYIKKSSIKDEKLFAPFSEIDLQSRDYIKKAISVAEDIKAGREVDLDKLAQIRDKATLDRNILKGDFVIQAILDFVPYKPKPRTLKKGKTVDKLVEEVFIRERDKECSITEFCKLHNISRPKYYRIKNIAYEDTETKERILAIKSSVGL